MRWTPTPEDRLLATENAVPRTVAPPSAKPSAPAESAAATHPADKPALSAAAAPTADEHEPAAPAARRPPAVWPGFRGPQRDGVVHGLRINTDWTSSPPVVCGAARLVRAGRRSRSTAILSTRRSSAATTKWCRVTDSKQASRCGSTAIAIRFWEAEGGAGPRATPTVDNGRVYAMGATGLVNALDAATGAVIWSHNAAAETQKIIPDWGVASSPVVIDGLVVVSVAGRLAAYDAATGAPRWLGPTGGGGYSSPHLVTIDGVPQIVLLRGARTISVDPADGKLLWEFSTGQPTVSVVQPAFTPEGDVLISDGEAAIGNGIRRVSVSRSGEGWNTTERWNSRGLKPAFNDFVVHKGHAYGFDGSILSAIDLADGSRKWKGGRYGNGQLLLLADQDLLLVVSEEGELALVSATPDQYTEVARIPALSGKTWNHPVVVGDTLLMRNGQEMAAFRLPRASGR